MGRTSELWERVELEEGIPLVFVGVHAVSWRSEWGSPTVGFASFEDSKLKQVLEVLEECKHHLEHAPFSYENGNTHQGIDEGEYYGMKAHEELLKKINAIVDPAQILGSE